jgi:hypothetical protein
MTYAENSIIELKKPGHGSRHMLQQQLQIFNDWHILPYECIYFYAIRSLKCRAMSLREEAPI